jgi:hypothetical protein
MNNKKYLVTEEGYFMKLAEIGGIHFVMKVTEHKTPKGTDYKCFGYARLNGVNIADWTYWAIEAEEAEAKQTREYLLRELIPLSQNWVNLSYNLVKNWSNSSQNLVKIWSNSGQIPVAAGQ